MNSKDPVNVQIGDNIKKIRKALGLTQDEMATRLNLKLSTFSNYENGSRSLPISQLSSIANELSIPIDFIINGIPDDIDIDDVLEQNSSDLDDLRRNNTRRVTKDNVILSQLLLSLSDYLDPEDEISEYFQSRYYEYWKAAYDENQLAKADKILRLTAKALVNLYIENHDVPWFHKPSKDFTNKLIKLLHKESYSMDDIDTLRSFD